MSVLVYTCVNGDCVSSGCGTHINDRVALGTQFSIIVNVLDELFILMGWQTGGGGVCDCHIHCRGCSIDRNI